MRILFYGTPHFSLPTFNSISSKKDWEVIAVVTQPDKAAGRGGKISASPIKTAAIERGIPILQPISVRKDPTFISKLEALGPIDVAIVIAFGQILPIEVLDFPKARSVNIHASLLPRWRGAAPIQRAIMAGDLETGVCLMDMEAGLDTGGVFSQAAIPIRDQVNYGTLHDELAALGAKLVEQDLEAIVNGSLKATPQPVEGVTYAQKINSEEARIDWSRPAQEIALKIRALSPRPGAFTLLENKRLKILSGQASASRSNKALAPGEISFKSDDKLEVQCGSDVLGIQQLQLEGKREISVKDFLRGYHSDLVELK